jgi:hypothetical protein
MQSGPHYLGIVVEQQNGWFLAELTVPGRPTLNDLATLLAHAMRRPLAGIAHRPKVVRLREHYQWRGLFPALKELGIEVSIQRILPKFNETYREYLQEMRKELRAGMVKPTKEQAKVASMFPAIAKYVSGYGYVEIGDQEGLGFVVRALGYGGLDFEDDAPETLAEAMAVLDSGLTKWFQEQGIKPE